MTHKISKNNTIDTGAILAIVHARSEWAQSASSVANPERVAEIREGALYDATGTKLRAYVNRFGVATLETNAEYKTRKGIASEAKQARKQASASAPAIVAPVAPSAPTVASKRTKKTAPASAPAPDTLDALFASTPASAPAIPHENAVTIRRIEGHCETLGITREQVESKVGPLDAMGVRALRAVNNKLASIVREGKHA